MMMCRTGNVGLNYSCTSVTEGTGLHVFASQRFKIEISHSKCMNTFIFVIVLIFSLLFRILKSDDVYTETEKMIVVSRTLSYGLTC